MKMPSFEELKALAEKNPEQLEALRQQMIEETISSAPESYQRRLRGLQFQVDMERRRAKNPMDSCIRISKMMHDHLYQMRETINGSDLELRSAIGGIVEATAEHSVAEPVVQASSTRVIPFPQIANR